MPDLSRRSFFRSVVAAGVAATIDPEELLWIPGKKKIFIPPAPAQPKYFVYLKQRTVDPWSEAQITIAEARDINVMVAKLRTLPGPNRVISAWGEWEG